MGLLAEGQSGQQMNEDGQAIGGKIGYFGLSEWWLSSFTEEERSLIKSIYAPLAAGSGISLVTGDILMTSQTVLSFLTDLASWFAKDEERWIAYRIFYKAEDLIDAKTDPLDLHFLYHRKIKILYKDREKAGLDATIEACTQQIALSQKSSAAFKALGGALPCHGGYEQLAIILEKQKRYEDAIEVSKKALAEGWNGTWDKRIERCRKKLLRGASLNQRADQG